LADSRYLWRAVDQDGDVIDILVQKRKDKRAAKRFFKKLLKGEGALPNLMGTDKLPSYAAAKSEMIPSVVHCQDRYSNNRARSRMSRHESKNDRCAGSSPQDRHSDFSRYTGVYRTYFE
jgi:transposase-like protein